jgi:DNA-binding response OmpR family regulator
MKPSTLIVDDSLTVRMDLKTAFEMAGFSAKTCSTIAEARQALRQEPFSLLVLDVLLPDGDGVELLSEIRRDARTASLPILLLSTEAHVRDRIRGMRTGADEYIGKPYDLAHVVARAKEITRGRAPVVASRAAPTVLVIDDSLTFRELLRERLEGAGHTVVTAASGEEGLRLAADLRPSAVVVDGVLPGIDGATVVRRLRLDAVLRRTPCMLLTASGDREAELLALDSGADAFMRKDEDVEMVLARVAAIVRSAGGGSEVDGPLSLLGPKKILAVDDSPTYLQALASQLAQDGYDVVLARSGEEALDLLAVQTVDCILMDLMMPGLSGQEACRRIKESPVTRDIPLMMLTALEERSAMLEGMSAGADDYIPKSGDFEVLRARLRAQLRRRQFEYENRRIRDKLLLREMEAAESRSARELAAARATLLADVERKNVELEATRVRLEETLAAMTAAKLAADEANHELESFSYSVSHDLRAPLRAIDGFTRVLVEDHGTQLDEEGKRVAAVICKNTAKMSTLIDDLLSFSRVGRQRAECSWLDMTSLAREAAAEVMDGSRKIDMVVEELPRAWGDAALLRQVWLNLLGNAVKYTRPRDVARVCVKAQTTLGEILYEVRDNGVGFDTRYKDKLFGVFQRLHSAKEFEGTGVGLALVHRIVRRHGGWIKAESELGEGATFTFALPRTGSMKPEG